MRSFIGFSFSFSSSIGVSTYSTMVMGCDVICEYHYIPRFCLGWMYLVGLWMGQKYIVLITYLVSSYGVFCGYYIWG